MKRDPPDSDDKESREQMRDGRKRLRGYGMLLWQQPVTAFATSASRAAKEKKEAEQKLNEANKRANEAQQKITNTQSEVTSLSSELSELIAEITLLEADIDYKNEQIHEAQGEYDAAKVREEEQYDAMKKRIKYMYERGETEYLDILLQVKSMTELLNKSEYIEALYTYDREKLEEFQETKLQVKQYKAQLENEKAEMEGMQLEYAAQQTELENTIARKRQEIANFDEQLAAAQAEAAAYTATIAKKNEQIRQAQAEEARRRAEAQRVAEEASRQAAEAARQSLPAARRRRALSWGMPLSPRIRAGIRILTILRTFRLLPLPRLRLPPQQRPRGLKRRQLRPKPRRPLRLPAAAVLARDSLWQTTPCSLSATLTSTEAPA